VRLPVALLLAGALAGGAASPTPLRLEARTADAVYTDGDRYAVIEDRGAVDIRDTRTGRKREVDATGCQVGSFADFQSHVSAGLALLQCAGGFDVLDLATGRRSPLPTHIIIDGVPRPAVYSHLGASWAVSEIERRCPAAVPYCEAYVNHRTGEQRILPYETGGEEKGYLDLDDPDLRFRPYCGPHRGVTRDGQRTYERPYVLDGGAPKRCGSRRELRRLPDALPDMMNLSAGLISWGDPYRGAQGGAHLFDFPTRRLYTWSIPQIRRTGHTPGHAVHTRQRIFVAASTRFFRSGAPRRVRVYSARLPREVRERLRVP
jgi:hypothetical protein